MNDQSTQSMRQAQRLFRGGRYDAARRVCETLKDAEPSNWEPHALLARIALKTENFSAVRDHLDKAASCGAPDDVIERVEGLFAKRAPAAAATGAPSPQPKSAEDAKPSADEKDPATVAAVDEPKKPTILQARVPVPMRVRVILQLIQDGDPSAALSKLRELLIETPNCDLPDGLLPQLFEARDDEAGCLEKLLAIAPENGAVRMRLAAVLLDGGDTEEAVSELATALALDAACRYPTCLLNALAKGHFGRERLVAKFGEPLSHKPRLARVLGSYAVALEGDGAAAEASALLRDNWDWAGDTLRARVPATLWDNTHSTR